MQRSVLVSLPGSDGLQQSLRDVALAVIVHEVRVVVVDPIVSDLLAVVEHLIGSVAARSQVRVGRVGDPPPQRTHAHTHGEM